MSIERATSSVGTQSLRVGQGLLLVNRLKKRDDYGVKENKGNLGPSWYVYDGQIWCLTTTTTKEW